METLIRTAEPEEREWANAQYEAIHFTVSTPGDELVIAERDGERVGLGRLVPLEDGSVELGGIWVEPGFRRQHIATALVQSLLERAGNRQCFCLPFGHLEEFYSGFGFARFDGDAPLSVMRKLGHCAVTYPDRVVVLARPTV